VRLTYLRLLVLVVAVLFVATCGSGGEDNSTLRGDTDGDDDDDVGDDDVGSDDDDDDDDNTPPPGDCVVPTDGMWILEDTVLCPSDEPYELEGSESGALFIASSDVTLTAYGVTLQGVGTGVGVSLYTDGLSDVEIAGLTLVNYDRGVAGYGSFTNITLRELTIADSGDAHVFIGPPGKAAGVCRNIRFLDLAVRDSYNTGVVCAECTESLMRGITSTNEREGVIESNLVLLGGSSNTIEDNTITTRNSAGCNAIWLSGVSETLVQNNHVDVGYKDGSHQHGSSWNVFAGNEFRVGFSAAYNVRVLDLDTGADKADRCHVYPKGYVPPTTKEIIPSTDNTYYGNSFATGLFKDESDRGTFCVDGSGNDYIDGASYQGPDENGGTCPD